MNSVYVDRIYIGKAKNLKALCAVGAYQGPLAIGGRL
jgi:hypothetical protein